MARVRITTVRPYFLAISIPVDVFRMVRSLNPQGPVGSSGYGKDLRVSTTCWRAVLTTIKEAGFSSVCNDRAPREHEDPGN